MQYTVSLLRASARSRHVHSHGRANIWRIENFNRLLMAQRLIARTTRGSSLAQCPSKRMYHPPPPSATIAPRSPRSSRMRLCMWCRRSTRAFSLLALYGFTCGMLPKAAAMAFSMVSVTNGTIGTAGTHARTPCWNPFLRWNPRSRQVADFPESMVRRVRARACVPLV